MVPVHYTSSLRQVGGRLGCRDISVTTLQKVTGVTSPKRHESLQSRGNAVEATFFVTAVLLCLTIDPVMIVLVTVFGSALLVVWSKKFDR